MESQLDLQCIRTKLPEVTHDSLNDMASPPCHLVHMQGSRTLNVKPEARTACTAKGTVPAVEQSHCVDAQKADAAGSVQIQTSAQGRQVTHSE